jgi:hypothetical protein
VAAGAFGGIDEAVAATRPAAGRRYEPDGAALGRYGEVYGVYRSLYDVLGRERAGLMYELKRLRAEAKAGRD